MQTFVTTCRKEWMDSAKLKVMIVTFLDLFLISHASHEARLCGTIHILHSRMPARAKHREGKKNTKALAKDNHI
jgi:hypothetical protein